MTLVSYEPPRIEAFDLDLEPSWLQSRSGETTKPNPNPVDPNDPNVWD